MLIKSNFISPDQVERMRLLGRAELYKNSPKYTTSNGAVLFIDEMNTYHRTNAAMKIIKNSITEKLNAVTNLTEHDEARQIIYEWLEYLKDNVALKELLANEN